MFRKPTVFILGAGASCHYGYPTGEALVAQVLQRAVRLRQMCKSGLKLRSAFRMAFGSGGDTASNDKSDIEERWQRKSAFVASWKRAFQPPSHW